MFGKISMSTRETNIPLTEEITKACEVGATWNENLYQVSERRVDVIFLS